MWQESHDNELDRAALAGLPSQQVDDLGSMLDADNPGASVPAVSCEATESMSTENPEAPELPLACDMGMLRQRVYARRQKKPSKLPPSSSAEQHPYTFAAASLQVKHLSGIKSMLTDMQRYNIIWKHQRLMGSKASWVTSSEVSCEHTILQLEVRRLGCPLHSGPTGLMKHFSHPHHAMICAAYEYAAATGRGSKQRGKCASDS